MLLLLLLLLLLLKGIPAKHDFQPFKLRPSVPHIKFARGVLSGFPELSQMLPAISKASSLSTVRPSLIMDRSNSSPFSTQISECSFLSWSLLCLKDIDKYPRHISKFSWTILSKWERRDEVNPL